MEQKLWLKIFALLLLALSSSATHGNETSTGSPVAPESPAGPGSTMAPGTLTAGPEPGSSLDESGQFNVSNNNNETSPSSGLDSTMGEETDSLMPLKTSTENGNTTVTNSSVILDTNGTITANATSRPALENTTLVTQSQPTAFFTKSSSTNKTETPPVPTPTSLSHLEITNTLQSHDPLHVDSITPTTKLTLPSNTPTTTTSSAITTASTTTKTTITTQTSSLTPAVKDKSPTVHSEVQSDAVSHKAITLSQLNVGEEIVHEGPTLDPLLAGLVSAFIIAAVIITLLLFLKLRRRDSRPEFRRLQDLPMDDMMEDTPLSMYSY